MKNLALVILLIRLCSTAISAEKDATSTDQNERPAQEDLLLENLGEDLLAPANDARTPSSSDNSLRKSQEGRTLRSPASGDWLAKIITPMDVAHRSLQRQGPIASVTAAQDEALAGIDAMIAELAKREQQAARGSSQRTDRSQSTQPQGAADKTGNTAANAASSANGSTETNVELAATGQLVKDLWGSLPVRQRQQILQPLSEEFLPKYAAEIEAYFRALADPQAVDRRGQQ